MPVVFALDWYPVVQITKKCQAITLTFEKVSQLDTFSNKVSQLDTFLEQEV